MKEKIKRWWNTTSETAYWLTGERFTNGDVVKTHLGLVLFFAFLGIVGAIEQAMEGGAAW